MKNVKSRNVNLRIVGNDGGNKRNSIGRELPGIHIVHRAGKANGESIPCEIEPHNITPYPAVPQEYGLQCAGYCGYRVALAPFRGTFSAVRFRGDGNGDNVVSGYVVDNKGYVESVAAESDEDGYAVLPLTTNSHALYASVPMDGGKPVWDTIMVRFL